MKISNGSVKLFDKGVISISSDIRIGEDYRIILASTFITIGLGCMMFAPGPWGAWASIFGGLAVGAMLLTDTRSCYTADQIEKVSMVSMDRVGTKGTGGTLGGAAIGGILFGGAGAIVGALAGGNKIEEFKNVAIKFTDGEWVVASSDKGLVGNVEFDALVKLAGVNNVCPI